MRKYVFIGIGGAIGAIARISLRGLPLFLNPLGFPLGTLVVNSLGAFLIAVVLTLAFEIMEMDVELRLGIVTGFLGGFTTFSTLTKETWLLMLNHKVFLALLYSIGSVVLGILCVYFGVQLVRRLFSTDKPEKEELGA